MESGAHNNDDGCNKNQFKFKTRNYKKFWKRAENKQKIRTK